MRRKMEMNITVMQETKMTIDEIMRLADEYADAKVTENSKNSLAAFFSMSNKIRAELFDALQKLKTESHL